MVGESEYGLWWLVVINSAVFIIFAFSFSKPETSRDWRSLGMYSAFIVALFTEMYGFPLTIYLLYPWLSAKLPASNLLSHDSGHLLEGLFGLGGNPHFGIFHIISYILIIYGFILLSNSWKVLHTAQRLGVLAVTGPYAAIRHPQYVAFVIIMFGFLFQWPTLITIIMFPVLVLMYIRLARAEEVASEQHFGEEWINYRSKTPAFIPLFKQ